MTTKSVPAATGEIATGKYRSAASTAGYTSKSTTTSPNLQAPSKTPRQVRTLAVPLYVPSDLENIPQWVAWRYDVDKNTGKPTKIPVNVHTGGKAKIDTPSTWSDFETALAYYHEHPDRVSGLFVVMPGTDLAGADFDHCVNDGVIQPQALAQVRALNSYTEYSPSSAGLRVFGLGVKPGNRSKQGDIELYDGSSKRFLSFTGRHLPGTPLELRDVTPEFAALYLETFPEAEPAPVVKR